ncbi:MAG: hypothetical protein ACI33O_15145 [Bhargavaea sp.]
MCQRQTKSAASKIRGPLSEVIAGALEDNVEVNVLQSLQDQFNDMNQDRFVLDQATLELPNNSLVQSLPLSPNVRNDAFHLNCCTVNSVAANNTFPDAQPDKYENSSVRATGHINWYLSFSLDTHFNDGEGGCEATVRLPFTLTGTTCVNQTLCENSDVLPDFCNGNTISLAFLARLFETEEKVTATYLIVHILPECA